MSELYLVNTPEALLQFALPAYALYILLRFGGCAVPGSLKMNRVDKPGVTLDPHCLNTKRLIIAALIQVNLPSAWPVL